jgi:hypothetical protein
VTEDQRTLIKTGYQTGMTPEVMASTIGVKLEDVKIFLAHWLDTAG